MVVLKPGQTATEEEIIAEASKHLASIKNRSPSTSWRHCQGTYRQDPERDLRDPYWQDETRQV
ncbi:MAG: hypothetical protein CM15mP103_07210 [Gammaproteobacteria bacterium]|nr:MAG: hypothetical protein CM15mP103_07210 [Gammaproteobacteria bacterium]